MPADVSSSDVQEAIAQLDGVRRHWLRRPGVTAVDVGFKIAREAIDTDQLALRVHVERKLPPDALPEHEVFNVSGEEPRRVGDFPVDVIEAAYRPAAQPAAVAPQAPEDIDRRGRFSQLIAGISVGNPRITAGTLGAIVWDRADGSVNILSNWHVLAGSLTASAGEPFYQAVGEPFYQAVGEPFYQAVGEPFYQAVGEPFYQAATVGEPIYQPGRSDGGTPSDTVAHLRRFRLDRDMDAAIARLSGARGYTRDLVGLERPITGVTAPRLGMEVVKSGRSTAVTRGMIDGVSLSTTIRYDHGPNTFHDQIHITPRPPWPAEDYELSLGGDSGSVWIEEATGRAVGLHFAGEIDPVPTSEHALANRMDTVAAPEGLNISFTPLVWPSPMPADMSWLGLCQRYPWLCQQLGRLLGRGGAPPSGLAGQAAGGGDGPAGAAADLRRSLQDLRAAVDTVLQHLT